MQPANQPQPTAPQPAEPQAVFPTAPQSPYAAQPSQPPAQPEQPAQKPKPQASQKAIATAQNTLQFSEMRENMIIMNDGSFRAVVRCQSINFDLMSQREREGVEYSYQNFLNSLYFPVQVLIRSRRIDIGPYLDWLLEIRRSQDNMLLNVLMDDYMNFVDILAQEANIMDKQFYVIVPFYPGGDIGEIKKQAKGLFDSFFSGTRQPKVTNINQELYEKAKDEVGNRVNSVMNGMFQMGVKCVQLNTQQLSELFYNSYNPDTAEREPIGEIDPTDLTTTFVRKGEGQPPQGGER